MKIVYITRIKNSEEFIRNTITICADYFSIYRQICITTHNEDNQALISPQFDGYDWPGGTFKVGEDTVQTLKRKFKEETGFDVEPIKLLDVETSLFHHYKRGTDHHSILVFYLVKIVGGELSDTGFDDDEREYAKLARWVNLDDLRKMHHACSVDIADKIIDLAQNETVTNLSISPIAKKNDEPLVS